MSNTVHWLTENYAMNEKVFSFRKFHGRHHAHRIRAHLKRIIVQYGLMDKITATTTDNGSNIKAATRLSFLFGIQYHCLAHGLNLTIHKGLHLWPTKQTLFSMEAGNVSEGDR
jgi:hypothetical protein